MTIRNMITQHLHLAASLLNVPVRRCSKLGPGAAILGRLESGEQPEMTCKQALLLTAVCPGYVLFEVLHNDFSSFADYKLHQQLMKCCTKSSSEGNVQSLKHESLWD